MKNGHTAIVTGANHGIGAATAKALARRGHAVLCTFLRVDRHGRSLQPVTRDTWTRQFTVDAMGAALMISEFARRHIARQADWGRIIGLTSGGELGFPEEVSYGAAKAAQENYTVSAGPRSVPARRRGPAG